MIKPLLLTVSTIGLLLSACGQASGQAPISNAPLAAQDAAAARQALPREDAIGLKKSNINWSALESYAHALSGEALNITQPGTHVLSGKSKASVNVSADGNVRLMLKGVEIQSSTGAAIHIESAKNTVIELAEGSENYLEDASKRKDKDVNGVIYSSDDLMFQGAGTLTLKANFQDGIVSKDDLDFFGGEYNISSVDDGIRGKDSLVIEGGIISILSKGDGIKSSNDNDSEKGNVHIKGGFITIESGDDGVSAVNNIVIDGGQISILKSLEGMEASTITINGGDVRVVASDDGINAVNNNGLNNMSITFNGGNTDVTVGDGDTDAIDSNGTILVAGGNINVTAPFSAFDSNRGNRMTGGNVFINGAPITELPNGHRRGPRGDGWGRGRN